MTTVSLQPVDSVVITTLVDNATDVLLPDKGPAKRPGLGDRAIHALAARFPDAFIQNSVGTRFEL